MKSSNVLRATGGLLESGLRWAGWGFLAYFTFQIGSCTYKNYAKEQFVKKNAAFSKKQEYEAAHPLYISPVLLKYKASLKGITEDGFHAGTNTLPWGTEVFVALPDNKLPAKGLLDAKYIGDKTQGSFVFQIDSRLVEASEESKIKPFQAITQKGSAITPAPTIAEAYTYESLCDEKSMKKIGPVVLPAGTHVQIQSAYPIKGNFFDSLVWVTIPSDIPGLSPDKKHVALVSRGEITNVKKPAKKTHIEKKYPETKKKKEHKTYKPQGIPSRGELAMRPRFIPFNRT